MSKFAHSEATPRSTPEAFPTECCLHLKLHEIIEDDKSLLVCYTNEEGVPVVMDTPAISRHESRALDQEIKVMNNRSDFTDPNLYLVFPLALTGIYHVEYLGLI